MKAAGKINFERRLKRGLNAYSFISRRLLVLEGYKEYQAGKNCEDSKNKKIYSILGNFPRLDYSYHLPLIVKVGRDL